VDESPFVYRKLDSVLEAHADTIEVETRLRPIVVVMAGADVVDPFKD
jgi:tRNA-splicing ligase RtcB